MQDLLFSFSKIQSFDAVNLWQGLIKVANARMPDCANIRATAAAHHPQSKLLSLPAISRYRRNHLTMSIIHVE
jgi:hypothetical protein